MSYKQTEEYLTVLDITKILRLNALTIYKYIKEGKLIAIEFGGHYRVSKTSLQSFIDDHKVFSRKEIS